MPSSQCLDFAVMSSLEVGFTAPGGDASLSLLPFCYMPPLPLSLFRVVLWHQLTFFATSVLLLLLSPLLVSVIQVLLRPLPVQLELLRRPLSPTQNLLCLA